MQIDLNIFIPKNSIGYLVLEYAKLNQRFQNVEPQSIYFKKGIESNRKRLRRLSESFACRQNFINNHSLDDLIKLLNEKQSFLDSVNWAELSNITQMARVATQNNIFDLKESISIKNSFESVPDIDELINDTEKLMIMISAT